MENSNTTPILGEIILYQPDDSIRLEVRLENDTVWLTLNQMAYLFDRDKSVISRHITNVFKEGELFIDSVVAIESVLSDLNDINEDTRMQLEIICKELVH